MEPLKELFNTAFYKQLAAQLSKSSSQFNGTLFLKEVTANMEPLSLNQRMRNTSLVLKKHLPASYPKALEVLMKTIPSTPRGYTNLLFPDFVGLYGHDHFDASMEALNYFTRFGSSEFAIREFLKRYLPRTIRVMQQWAEDKDHHVRRLASEGSRPRLPWSFKLDAVIGDPGLTRPILERLKEDEELYVRKSVANHLNDISKDHPDFMLRVVNSWNRQHPHTAWIVKHASRSLIKKGHADSLSVFGFEKNIRVGVENLAFKKNSIRLGESLEFSFDLLSGKNSAQKLVVDYVIHYCKPSGARLPKVFKLKELTLATKAKELLVKKQLLKDFTTRKHTAGMHLLQIQVNGRILAEKEFKLML